MIIVYQKISKLIDNVFALLILFILCLFNAIVLGFAVAGEQIFAPKLYNYRLDMIREWRFKNEHTSIVTVSIRNPVPKRTMSINARSPSDRTEIFQSPNHLIPRENINNNQEQRIKI